MRREGLKEGREGKGKTKEGREEGKKGQGLEGCIAGGKGKEGEERLFWDSRRGLMDREREKKREKKREREREREKKKKDY